MTHATLCVRDKEVRKYESFLQTLQLARDFGNFSLDKDIKGGRDRFDNEKEDNLYKCFFLVYYNYSVF